MPDDLSHGIGEKPTRGLGFRPTHCFACGERIDTLAPMRGFCIRCDPVPCVHCRPVVKGGQGRSARRVAWSAYTLLWVYRILFWAALATGAYLVLA